MAKAAKFELTDDSVVVIIGSGAGGGTLGNELAQKGIDTVILEGLLRRTTFGFEVALIGDDRVEICTPRHPAAPKLASE